MRSHTLHGCKKIAIFGHKLIGSRSQLTKPFPVYPSSQTQFGPFSAVSQDANGAQGLGLHKSGKGTAANKIKYGHRFCRALVAEPLHWSSAFGLSKRNTLYLATIKTFKSKLFIYSMYINLAFCIVLLLHRKASFHMLYEYL